MVAPAAGLTGLIVTTTLVVPASQAGVSVAQTTAQVGQGWNGVYLNEASLDAKEHEAIRVPPVTGG